MAIEAVSFEEIVREEVGVQRVVVVLAIVAQNMRKVWKSVEEKLVQVQWSSCDVVNYSLLISCDGCDSANCNESRDD
jgi:hypothetical protein